VPSTTTTSCRVHSGTHTSPTGLQYLLLGFTFLPRGFVLLCLQPALAISWVLLLLP